MAMNQSIIFVGVGLLAAAALFMAQGKGVAAAPPPRGRLTGTEQTTLRTPTVTEITSPTPQVEEVSVEAGLATEPISVQGDPEVNVIATKRGYVPPIYQYDYF